MSEQRSDQFYSRTMRIFRGVVTSVEDLYAEDGQTWKGVEIYVRDVQHDDDALAKRAFPPSHMPTSVTGGGGLSVPTQNQQVIACWHPDMVNYQILSYVTTGETSPFGALSPEKVTEGDLVTKIGGKVKSIFHMGAGGIMKLTSNAFANFEVNGGDKSINMTSKNYEQVFAGGRRYDTYLELDPLTGRQERTNHLDVWTEYAGNPGFQDIEMNTTETNPTIPDPVNGYTNKTVIQAGSQNINPHFNELPASLHQLQIDTRQVTDTSTGNMFKDTITSDRRGYRTGHYPFGTTQFEPEGTLADFRAKRNATGDVQTYLQRFGAYKDNWGTKAAGAATPTPGTAATDSVTGESYRLQIYNGIGDNLLPLGNPFTDAMGDGQGYDFEFPMKSDTLEQYTESFGLLTSNTAGDGVFESLWRFHVHNRDIVGNLFSVTEKYGGSYTSGPKQYYRYDMDIEAPTGPVFKHLKQWITNSAQTAAVYQEKWEQEAEQSHVLFETANAPEGGGYIKFRRSAGGQRLQALDMTELQSGGLTTRLFNQFQSSKVTELLMTSADNPGGNITLNNSVDTLVMDNGVVTTTAGSGTTTTIMQDAAQIDLANATDSININGGTITIDAGGLSSITVGPDSIVIANPVNTLTIDAAGMNLNGSTLLTNNFLTWMGTATGMWGMGNMGAPVPMFPATLATYNAQANLPFPAGFTT